jgi:hypothetical protein
VNEREGVFLTSDVAQRSHELEKHLPFSFTRVSNEKRVKKSGLKIHADDVFFYFCAFSKIAIND